MIIQTISQNDFHDAFRAYGRDEHFPYGGLNALYNYLEEMSEGTGTPYELDVIALCCEFTAYVDLEELQGDYDAIEDMSDLEDNTLVIMIDDTSFIIQRF